jgi:crotonobetainyl-CoA:carnitine CoA-transferase CaiB-like acyl-CoA transferase
LALGIVARDRTGKAQTMLTTMLTSTAHALADDMVEYADRPRTTTADRELFGFGPLYRLYRASDEWIFLAAPAPREWPALTRALENDVDLDADPRFRDTQSRHANASALADVLSTVFSKKPAQHWEDQLLGFDVGCVVAHKEPPEVVLQSKDFAVASDLLVEVEHPTFGEHVRLKPYVEMSRNSTVAEPGSLVGQHTDRILRELGYSADAISALRERKVVA